MANALFDAGRDAFANGNIDWVNDTIKVIGCDTADDDPDVAVDDNFDDIASAARVGTGTLAGNSTSAGVCDANDTTMSSVSGDQFEELILYRDSGVESTSTLIVRIDTAPGDLPFTPSGGDITIQWSSGSDKIFKL